MNYSWPGPGQMEERLNRALVAGLMLETILESPGLPENPSVRQGLIKARVQRLLVSCLAGRVSLDRFRALAANLDCWLALFLPLIQGVRPTERQPSSNSSPAMALRPLSCHALREDLLDKWLARTPGLLPARPHRKLNLNGLKEFVRGSQGGWFRLKDFQEHFHIDRKTAWEYLQKLRQAGPFCHNRGRSAAVRYALATRFLAVDADRLRPAVAAALAGLPRRLTDSVADLLLATGGEPFWEEAWCTRLEPAAIREIVDRLLAASILQILYQSGLYRLIRLAPAILQDQKKTENPVSSH